MKHFYYHSETVFDCVFYPKHHINICLLCNCYFIFYEISEYNIIMLIVLTHLKHNHLKLWVYWSVPFLDYCGGSKWRNKHTIWTAAGTALPSTGLTTNLLPSVYFSMNNFFPFIY